MLCSLFTFVFNSKENLRPERIPIKIMNFERGRRLAVPLSKIPRTVLIFALETISELKRFLDHEAIAQKVTYIIRE